MRFKNILILFSATLLVTSCIKEDHFGESEFANIKKIVVSNQSGNAIINMMDATVSVEIPGGVDLSAITIQTLELSSFAISEIGIGEVINLNEEVSIKIISEGGTVRDWTISAFVASAEPQFQNSNLNEWYKTNTNYYEPGENALITIWGTGNHGTHLLNKLATIPKDLGNGNLAAQMITLDNGSLGNFVGAPISSGSLFTGFFNPDKISTTDPEAAIEFGTPFAGRPSKIRLKYSYTPGEVNKDKAGNILDSGDACDVYALLEVRMNGKIERLATAWFRSKDLQSELITIEIPFTYGPLDNSHPDYMKPTDGSFVSADLAQYMLPTHITFVASSSYGGAIFAGAIGSTLVVDDIELIYE